MERFRIHPGGPERRNAGVKRVTVSGEGTTRHEALDALLRAVTGRVGGDVAKESAEQSVAAPIRGEGDDLAALVADLLADLFDQREFFGSGFMNVILDGIVRRDDGGYVAWGYASGTPEPGSHVSALELAGMPQVDERPSRVVIRVELEVESETRRSS